MSGNARAGSIPANATRRNKMGDHYSKALLQKLVPKVDGTVLEIGSLDNGDGKATSLREFYGDPYYGIDIQAGNNVDYVLDLCKEHVSKIPWPQEVWRGVSLAYAISVFEHLEKPWIAANVVSSFLQKGGLLFISVPWIWRWHGYPDDYFRYSFSGIKSLFPEIEWIYQGTADQQGNYTEYIVRPGNNNRDEKNILRHKGQKYLPYTVINMLGRKV